MEVICLQLLNILKRNKICSVLTWKNTMYIVFTWRKVFSASIVNRLRDRLPGNRGSIPEGAEIFRHLLLTTFAEHQASCSTDTEVFSPGSKVTGV